MRGCPGVDRVESEQALDGDQVIPPGSGINSLNLEMSLLKDLKVAEQR